jgi:hypothetical protein
LRKTQGIEKFYDEQEQRLTADLLKAEQGLKAFQQREGIVDAAKEVDQSLTGLAGAEKSLNETDSLIRETERRIALLETQLKGQQPTVSASKSITPDLAYQSIRGKLTQLELERQSLLQRYMPKDRLVLDKEREIVELKKQLEQTEKTAVGSENISLNAVHQRILNELLSAKVQLRACARKKLRTRHRWHPMAPRPPTRKRKASNSIGCSKRSTPKETPWGCTKNGPRKRAFQTRWMNNNSATQLSWKRPCRPSLPPEEAISSDLVITFTPARLPSAQPL